VQTVSQLLEAMGVAARSARKSEFDRLERELLSRFEGGFEGIPAEIYSRYLEVDRAWPAVPFPPQERADEGPEEAARPRPPVGPAVELTVELPEELVCWLAELGDESGCNRSEVLSECLQTLRWDERLASTLRDRLAARHRR
jgi:hypothetical protein